jgi:Zn-dependent protease
MDDDLVDALKWYIIFLCSTACHEAAHAWAAHRMGDDTAYRGGQVSLNPAPHIRREPMGMVVVPLLSYFLGGWMIGWASAPYNRDWALRYPQRSALMALAGPAANLVLVLVAALLMRVGIEWGVFRLPWHASSMQVIAGSGAADGFWSFCAKMLSLTFSLNLLLGVFNLLPLPPLDGSSLPLLFLRHRPAEKFRDFIQSPGLSWIGIFVAWKIFSFVQPPLFVAASKLLYQMFPAR